MSIPCFDDDLILVYAGRILLHQEHDFLSREYSSIQKGQPLLEFFLQGNKIASTLVHAENYCDTDWLVNYDRRRSSI